MTIYKGLNMSRTNYNEKRFNGKKYDTVVEAVNAGATSYMRMAYSTVIATLDGLNVKYKPQRVAQELYEVKRKQIIDAMNITKANVPNVAITNTI